MELDDVANVLKIQLAMLVTQGSEDADGAMEFLDEIYETSSRWSSPSPSARRKRTRTSGRQAQN